MTVKKHYDEHLGNFYSWMIGDLEPKIQAFQDLLIEQDITPGGNKVALDLGAGNGIQSIALKNLGYEVIAIDFNRQLLDELRSNPLAEGIQVVEADLLSVSDYKHLQPELIVCCGDTITHLESQSQIATFIKDSVSVLADQGQLILTFRDYAEALNDSQRFIPVKSDETRILTCILEYHTDKVKVTDLLYELQGGQWHQRVSSYHKVRIANDEMVSLLEDAGMTLELQETFQRMQLLIGRKVR